MAGKCNIVQAEFFHVGNVRSLDELFGEIADRLKDRMALKTVVRFVDEGGVMTSFVRDASTVSQKKEKLYLELFQLKGWRQWWQSLHVRRLSRNYSALKKKGDTLVADQLARALTNPSSVAIERNDHSFRRIDKNETHDVLEAARAATNVWLFVFEPNDLLADNNKSVAYVM